MAAVRVSGREGYAEGAETFFGSYEAISFAEMSTLFVRALFAHEALVQVGVREKWMNFHFRQWPRGASVHS
nr:MAG: hypothetical protein E4H34_05135 [Hyphomicrobiales bacterium]